MKKKSHAILVVLSKRYLIKIKGNRPFHHRFLVLVIRIVSIFFLILFSCKETKETLLAFLKENANNNKKGTISNYPWWDSFPQDLKTFTITPYEEAPPLTVYFICDNKYFQVKFENRSGKLQLPGSGAKKTKKVTKLVLDKGTKGKEKGFFYDGPKKQNLVTDHCVQRIAVKIDNVDDLEKYVNDVTLL